MNIQKDWPLSDLHAAGMIDYDADPVGTPSSDVVRRLVDGETLPVKGYPTLVVRAMYCTPPSRDSRNYYRVYVDGDRTTLDAAWNEAMTIIPAA